MSVKLNQSVLKLVMDTLQSGDHEVVQMVRSGPNSITFELSFRGPQNEIDYVQYPLYDSLLNQRQGIDGSVEKRWDDLRMRQAAHTSDYLSSLQSPPEDEKKPS